MGLDRLISIISDRLPRDFAYILGGALFLTVVHFARYESTPELNAVSTVEAVLLAALSWALGLVFSEFGQATSLVPKALPWEWLGKNAPRPFRGSWLVYRLSIRFLHGITKDQVREWACQQPKDTDPINRTDFLMHIGSALCTASAGSFLALFTAGILRARGSQLVSLGFCPEKYVAGIIILGVLTLWMWWYTWYKHVQLIIEVVPKGCRGILKNAGESVNMNELSEGFWGTVGDSSALDLVADLGEMGLDTLIQGPLKEVPILGSLVNLWRAGVQVRDRLFVAKLIRFLRAVRNGDPKAAATRAFADQVAKDEGFRTRVGTNVMLAIENLDNIDKPELLARAFLRLTGGEVDYDRFCEFALAIDRGLLSDFDQLAREGKRMEIEPAAATRLSSCGLLEIENIPTIDGIGAGNFYQVTEMGDLFTRLVLEK